MLHQQDTVTKEKYPARERSYISNWSVGRCFLLGYSQASVV
jgi:hypothetical protein